MSNKNILIILLCFISVGAFANVSHIIKKGETLYSLAKKYNTSVDEIILLNKIDDISSIEVGTKILLPENNISLNKYTVAKGDTLYSISKKFNLALSTLREYNNLEDGSIISLGQVLIVSEELSLDLVSPVAQVDPAEPVEEVEVVKQKSLPYWPLKGEITSYDGRIKGVEIKGEPGDYIKAVSNGKVIWYDSYKGIGKVVLIEGENGYDYLYGTKESLNVKMGVNINAGDRLGRLKENNTSLVFSVFKNGKPLSDISRAPR